MKGACRSLRRRNVRTVLPDYDGATSERSDNVKSGLDNPDLTLVEMFDAWPATIPVFVHHRMLCVGCLISPFHTLANACDEYGLEQGAFMAELLCAVETE